MKANQQGFTLVEIAIVLVIIGLLLGGVLKGQELINSAKAKSLVNDFRTISTAIYAYQDRFRFMPGDDPAAGQHVGGELATTPATDPHGNGRIGGSWNSSTTTDESFLVWQHLRLANLLTGTTTLTDTANYSPRNADNGVIGITGTAPITPASGATGSAALPMTGTFFICSDGITARLARQVDSTMDDGNTQTGNVRAMAQSSGASVATGPAIDITAAVEASAAGLYTVCVAF
ncbi:MAG: prepilin-type N-terminal cleavage/methylation domain-containing protein [Methyloversatilis sp.]|jgi:prepilin-type N-terminal cleavage/methylation domain-containing protein|nr:prepilin-type N-terminal cleavage/methylation domain-containing protein [Methyloversatilis sp.]MBP6192811.1 prepilin-type N-terminal cleavage/methylation domain-containing protein [Methyloversatilis sp.]MBP9116447.1 prepilin-type N-terminal cleavage/methylation domain-containing protein [Methyloversatilis sp.]